MKAEEPRCVVGAEREAPGQAGGAATLMLCVPSQPSAGSLFMSGAGSLLLFITDINVYLALNTYK